jgi:hypothetical protein
MNNDYSSIFALLGGFIVVLLIIVVIMYILTALGMQAMAKKLNIENSWLAWIPVANAYLMGKIAGDRIKIFDKDIQKLGMVLLIGAICVGVLSFIPVIGTLLAIAYAVLYFVALYKIFKIFSENNAALFCVLSIVINVTEPFFIYFSSKNQPNLAIFNEGNSDGFKETPVPVQPVITEPVTVPDTAETSNSAPGPAVEQSADSLSETIPEETNDPAAETALPETESENKSE